MSFKTKTSSITKILYTILILCIVGIMVLSVYSLFKQNDETNENNLNNLKNDDYNNLGGAEDIIDYDSEEALKNFYRNQTTENPSNTNNTAHTGKPENSPGMTATPNTTQPATVSGGAVEQPEIVPEEQNLAEQLTPADDEMNEANKMGENSADLIIEPTEEAVEVIAVPVPEASYIKPADGNVLKTHNLDVAEYSVIMNDYRTHAGIDIEGEIGTGVKAVCDGVISEITDEPLMGKTVVINHADGVQSVYMNLQQSLPQNISVGTEVKRGDIIGGVGDTALIEISDTEHLHFEMKKDGKYIDPFEYINF